MALSSTPAAAVLGYVLRFDGGVAKAIPPIDALAPCDGRQARMAMGELAA